MLQDEDTGAGRVQHREMSVKVCVFFEQITPSIREENSMPGESFKRAYERLKSLDLEGDDREALTKILAVIGRIDQLPNSAFVELNGIFERELMHPND